MSEIITLIAHDADWLLKISISMEKLIILYSSYFIYKVLFMRERNKSKCQVFQRKQQEIFEYVYFFILEEEKNKSKFSK